MATVVVTDGDQRSALAVVRSLGRAGYRCVVASSSGRSIAGASRYASRDMAVPGPGSAPAAFASAVRDIVVRERADLVLPVTEESILALLSSGIDVPAVLPLPDLATFRAVCDKAHVLGVASSVGIRVPAQRVIVSRDDAAVEGMSLPIVLKPARSVFTASDGTRSKVSVSWAHTSEQLVQSLEAYPDAAFPVLAQEAITGAGVGIFVFMHDGHVLARFAHRRIHEKPPAGGVSVLCQSEPMDEAVYDRTLSLLRALNWSGVAMVEYKRDDATGEPVLMEINGRFWGSLQLAIDAGVDFPRIVADASLGTSVRPVMDYSFARTRWEWGHVDHLIARVRSSDATLRDRVRALGQWLRAFGPRTRNEVLRATDPRPFYRETLQWFGHIARR